jgi:hypothetical protein
MAPRSVTAPRLAGNNTLDGKRPTVTGLADQRGDVVRHRHHALFSALAAHKQPAAAVHLDEIAGVHCSTPARRSPASVAKRNMSALGTRTLGRASPMYTGVRFVSYIQTKNPRSALR